MMKRRLMRSWLIALAAILVIGLELAAAKAGELTVRVDLSEQSMQVRLDRRLLHQWPVSTARPGYRTPTGTFHPVRLERMWYSTIYDYAPMPFSIFFFRGYAIHGTTEVDNLGTPASHGCIRLHPDNAERLFALVQQEGRASTTIVIVP